MPCCIIILKIRWALQTDQNLKIQEIYDNKTREFEIKENHYKETITRLEYKIVDLNNSLIYQINDSKTCTYLDYFSIDPIYNTFIFLRSFLHIILIFTFGTLFAILLFYILSSILTLIIITPFYICYLCLKSGLKVLSYMKSFILDDL